MVILKMKNNFYSQKNLILIDDLDISKIILSNKVSFGKKGFKYFIGYKDNETKYMSFDKR